jgi:hypothetical protein
MNTLYRNCCETVASVDEQVGRRAAKLEDLQIKDDTNVIYAGDNGYFWGEHGLCDKRLAYEESIPIPGITGIRTKQFKYIIYQNDKRPREIFDLQAGPGEKENIINTERGRMPEKALKQELERLKKESGHRFVSRG